MLIAQISDTHILSPESDRPAANLRADCLAQCVADINLQQPDAVILTGDTVQHGQPDEYALLRALLGPLQAPLYLVPGNRDDNDVLRAAFSDCACFAGAGDFLQYAIEDHAVRLVGLDSTLPGERKGRFCERRQDWLARTLEAQPDRPTLLFIHHPPFDVGDHYVGGYRLPEEAAALDAIVSRHPQVAGLLCGHVHWPVQREWAGTEARIMPSVAVDLRKGIDEDRARGRPIYLLHRVSGEGLVSEPRVAGAAT
ncbi:MAG TPA: phosphodiesterase [Woeseiaceae bacterium]